MIEKKISFFAGELQLEGFLAAPQKAEPSPGVAICHPHPLYGGDMHNNVVRAICDELIAQGIAALRFNFRGTGHSQGCFSEGIGEEDDVLAALNYLIESEDIDAEKIGLAGYSFGAMVAVKASVKSQKLRGVAAVSPVVTPALFESVKHPLLVICGEADEVTPLHLVRQALNHSETAHTLKTIPEVDHFWWGQEQAMAQAVALFLKAQFNPNADR